MGNLGILMGGKIFGDFGIASSLFSNRVFPIMVDSEREEKKEALGETESGSEDLLGDLLCDCKRFSKFDIFLVTSDAAGGVGDIL